MKQFEWKYQQCEILNITTTCGACRNPHRSITKHRCLSPGAWWIGAPASAQDISKYEVTGFREARFGMSEQDVRALVVKTLGVKPADIASAANPVEGTNVLTVRLAALDPAPGPAQIAYIFGYGSKKLIQVNVIWGEDKPNRSNAMITAGTRLERYFAGFAWRKDTTRAGIPVGDNTVVLFSGETRRKARSV